VTTGNDWDMWDRSNRWQMAFGKKVNEKRIGNNK
jgi:hypothetical protein